MPRIETLIKTSTLIIFFKYFQDLLFYYLLVLFSFTVIAYQGYNEHFLLVHESLQPSSTVYLKVINFQREVLLFFMLEGT